jgi:outer membrane receptor for ferrienterochelin and colicin
VTIQQTELKSYSPDYNDAGAYNTTFPFPYTYAGSKDKTVDTKSSTTPKLWAGFNLVVVPIEKLSFDLSGYYYDAYKLHMSAEKNTQTGVITDQTASSIDSKFLLNLNTVYRIHPQVALSINVRNMLNQKSPEGFGSDQMGTSALFGVSLNY